ncbi:uncharacterized protein LOC129312025 [Prosopis cineraria]|uniref:uncharacterized protein LOC129312025 n=1 Tax=Prosopis cineraria TaxID=364024 RepID=UPI00240F5B7A|nr:uncharacterized protein LOC129312025 [Prosopis cineraria]
MKAGGCRDSFIDWEKCIEEAEKNKEDIVDKCVEATAKLKKCMEAHADYYEPILRAERRLSNNSSMNWKRKQGQRSRLQIRVLPTQRRLPRILERKGLLMISENDLGPSQIRYFRNENCVLLLFS